MSLPSNLRNTWFKLANQNLAVFMRDVGFDLAVYESYPEEVQLHAKRLAIKAAMNRLNDDFYDETEHELSVVKKGVYVIRLAGNMSVRYKDGNSPIIYIGQGNLTGRIKSHYEAKLFDFMQSLSGANFDFYVCEPWKSRYRGNDFHKQIEHTMISDFTENFGGLNDRFCFPLMNRISGSDRNVPIEGNWWRTPLKQTKRKTTWILKPGPNSEFVGAL
jgi:hypothetical protein